MQKLRAIDKIAAYLSRRDYSSFELEQRLLRAKYEKSEIQQALEEARDRKWLLPPAELAEKVALALGKKGKSKRYIGAYLKKLKLPMVETDLDVEIKKGLELVNKRLRLQPPFTFEQKQKILQFLRNRSFDEACIRKVIHHEIA